MNTDEHDWWIIGLQVGVPAILVAIFGTFFYFAIQEGLRSLEPNGMVEQVPILNTYVKSTIFYDTRMCIYEIEGVRKEISDCLYETGEMIKVFQTKDGRWYLQRYPQN